MDQLLWSKAKAKARRMVSLQYELNQGWNGDANKHLIFHPASAMNRKYQRGWSKLSAFNHFNGSMHCTVQVG